MKKLCIGILALALTSNLIGGADVFAQTTPQTYTSVSKEYNLKSSAIPKGGNTYSCKLTTRITT